MKTIEPKMNMILKPLKLTPMLINGLLQNQRKEEELLMLMEMVLRITESLIDMNSIDSINLLFIIQLRTCTILTMVNYQDTNDSVKVMNQAKTHGLLKERRKLPLLLPKLSKPNLLLHLLIFKLMKTLKVTSLSTMAIWNDEISSLNLNLFKNLI